MTFNEKKLAAPIGNCIYRFARLAAFCERLDQGGNRKFVLVGTAGEKNIRKVGFKLGQFRKILSLALPNANSTTPTYVYIFEYDYAPREIKRIKNAAIQTSK